MSLSELLPTLRQRLEAGVCTDKADIRSYVVNPLLDALGWTTSDPLLVKQEFPTTSGMADYALLGSGSTPLAIIGVEQANPFPIGSATQLFEYASTAGVGYLVLTNGVRWQFYLAGATGDIPSRCFWSGSMHNDLSACEDAFEHFLAQSAMVRDHPNFPSAASALNGRLTRRRAQAQLPEQWLELLQDPDSILVDALVEASGVVYAGHRDDVVRFLQDQADRHKFVPDVPRVVQPDRQASFRSMRASRTTFKAFTLYGKKYEFRHGRDTYLALIEQLVGFDIAELERLSNALSFQLAQVWKHDSTETRAMIEGLAHYRYYSSDWFVNVNCSTEEFCNRSERIANYFGLKIGRELLLHVE